MYGSFFQLSSYACLACQTDDVLIIYFFHGLCDCWIVYNKGGIFYKDGYFYYSICLKCHQVVMFEFEMHLKFI